MPIQSFDDYNQALAYAQSIERVAKADRNEQIRLLGAYAKSVMPQRSAWAIATLAQSGIPIKNKSSQEILKESQKQQWLVRAKAVVVEKNKDGSILSAQWRIEQVFNGPPEMKNASFDFLHSYGISSSSGFVPSVDRGNEGIWLVGWDGAKATPLFVSSVNQIPYGLRWPIIENHPQLISTGGFAHPEQTKQIGLGYKEALAYAQSIERVAKADRNEQIRLLGAYAKSSMPQRSAWAIATLAQSGVEAAPRFLLDLADDAKIPVAGQLALDAGLQQLDEAGEVQWSASSARLALWRRLVTAPTDENDAFAIVSGIVDLARQQSRASQGAPAIAGTQLFAWLRLAANNAKWTPSARARAVSSVGQLAEMGAIGRAVAFDYLLERLRALPPLSSDTNKLAKSEIDFALGPLYGLQALRPLSDAETAPLQKLRPRFEPTYLKSWFQSLFEKAS